MQAKISNNDRLLECSEKYSALRTLSVPQLSWFTVSICVIWIILVYVVRQDYHLVCRVSVDR
jgi:hypothetical protein